MKFFSGLLVLAASFGLLQAAEPDVHADPNTQLNVVRYSFSAKTMPDENFPGINDDPGFKKLTDGVILSDEMRNTGGKKVVWRHILNNQEPLVIRFDFAEPVKLKVARIHFFRWKDSYGIKAIKLVAVEEEKRIPLGNVTLNHPYRKPEADPFHDAVDIQSDDSQELLSVELIFQASGGFLALHEVEFFGKNVPLPKKTVETSAAHPLEKKLVERTPEGLRIYQEGEMYVMENKHSIYVIDPRYTGTVNMAYDRIGKRNMVLYANPGEGYGPIYGDRFYPGDFALRDMYRYLPYKAEIIADAKDKKQLRVAGTGRSGIFRNVKIEKTYTLTADSSILKTDFAVNNGLDNVAPLGYGYWMCGGVQSPDGYSLILPGSGGTEKYPYVRQLVMRDISSGWLAAYANSGDQGLALTMPYDLLKEFYFWGDNIYRGTIEFKLGIYPIKAGEALRFSTAICPFSGIGAPDKVTELAAMSFGDPLKNPLLKFRFFQPGDYTLCLSGGFLTKGNVSFAELQKTPLKKDFFAEVPYQLPVGKGTFVLKAELLQNGRSVFFAETTCNKELATGTWNITPDCERKPDIADSKGKLNLDFHSLEEETPHIKWGKPYAGGRPKVLAINLKLGGIRDMVELAQRFDFDLTSNYIAGLWSLSGHVMSLSINDCIKQLIEKLKTRYDVIVVSGDIWELIPENIATQILSQVQEGAGLILTAPSGHPAELQKLFRMAKKNIRITAPWEKMTDDFTVTGIPFEVLPATRAFRYEQSGGKVLATVNASPLLSEFQYGKGKLFLAAWEVERPRRSDNERFSSFFLPMMSYNDPRLDWHYWEYHTMLFGRMIYDAARRPSGIDASRFLIQEGKLDMRLHAASDVPAKIEVTVRDKFSREVKNLTQNVVLKQGDNDLFIALPPVLLEGLHFADTVISTASGKAWWGSAVWRNQTTARIEKCTVPERIFQQQEVLSAEVVIQGQGSVITRLYDNHGNEFARSEGEKASLPLMDCQSPAFRLLVELEQNGKVIDRMVKHLFLYRKPNPKRFQITQGWPAVSEKTPLWLTGHYIRLLQKYGITCTSGSAPAWDVKAVEMAFRENDVLFLSSDGSGSVGGKYPFDREKKIQSKFDLIRTPCLSDQDYLKNLSEKSCKFNPGAFKYGTLLLAGADEANMFSNWDGCFSVHCLREFRLYMEKVYGSLSALNQSWKTAYTEWDEVLPMTLDEVRKHSSYAPWMDHRTFNDRQRAGAFAVQVAGIAKADPDMALSLSGTSDTNPWNAWDYYQIMPLMKAMAGYGGEQSIQHRSFCKVKLFSMPWIGYDVGYDQHNMQVLRYLTDGATGLNIYGGSFYYAPDWTMPPLGKELKKVLDRYLNGRADVIRNFNCFSYPLAFHYSPASIKADWLENLDAARKSGTLGFKTIVGDCALSYDYLAYGDLEKEQFGKTKVLFLPLSMALSEKEILGLQKFVSAGGILIADYGTGHFDVHGVRQPDRKELLELFGLKCFGTVKQDNVEISGNRDGMLNGLKMNASIYESGIKPSSAQAIGEIRSASETSKACFVNRYGKGSAVYLAANFPGILGEQSEIRYNAVNRKNTDIINGFFRKLFSQAGIVPLVTAPTLRGTELRLMEQNSCYILGVLRDIGQTQNFETGVSSHTIDMREKFHVWDLVEEKYLGYGNSFASGFGPVSQSLFVLLPYKPEKLESTLSGRGRRFTVDFRLKADSEVLADHILRITLLNPDGSVNPAYTQLFFTSAGKGTMHISLPLNQDAAGWKLAATDVMTGVSTELILR